MVKEALPKEFAQRLKPTKAGVEEGGTPNFSALRA
jgi:hypothetical protein